MAMTRRKEIAQLDVNLRRMMAKCEQLLQDQATLSESGTTGNAYRFQNLLVAMQQTVDELEQKAAGDGSAGGPNMVAYRLRIQRFANLLDPLKLTTPTDRSLSYHRRERVFGATTSSSATQSATQSATPSTTTTTTTTATLNHLHSSHTDRSIDLLASKATQKAHLVQRAQLLSETQEAGVDESLTSVQFHRNLQEQVSTDMIRMAQQLKTNSLAFRDVLKQDELTTREAVDAMDANQSRLQKENKRVRAVIERYGTTFWVQVLLTLLVVLTFLWVYMLIRWFPSRKLAVITEPSVPTVHQLVNSEALEGEPAHSEF